MKHIFYLPIIISLCITAAHASGVGGPNIFTDEHEDRLKNDARYKESTKDYPGSKELRAALRAHQDDVMKKKAFDTKFGESTWKVSDIKVFAPEYTEISRLINVPFNYDTPTSGSKIVAKFIKFKQDWLSFTLERVAVESLSLPMEPKKEVLPLSVAVANVSEHVDHENRIKNDVGFKKSTQDSSSSADLRDVLEVVKRWEMDDYKKLFSPTQKKIDCDDLVAQRDMYLRLFLKQHQEDLFGGRRFGMPIASWSLDWESGKFKFNLEFNWTASGYVMRAPKGTSFETLINLPITYVAYKTDTTSEVVAKFTHDKQEWLTVHLRKENYF